VTGAAGCDEIVAQVGEYSEGIGFPREADDGWAESLVGFPKPCLLHGPGTTGDRKCGGLEITGF